MFPAAVFRGIKNVLHGLPNLVKFFLLNNTPDIMKFHSLMAVFAAFALSVLPAFSQSNPFGSRGATILNECVLELGGNAYVTSGTGAKIDNKKGLFDWTDSKTIITVYFSLGAPQKEVDLSILAKGHGKIALNINGRKTIFVDLDSDATKEYSLGRFDIGDETFQKGYQKIFLRGKTPGKDGKFGEVESIILRGMQAVPAYVQHADNYWGRRGPSVHVAYTLPRYKSIEYFYNEVTVPRGCDPVGSFFMVNGFDTGYLGLQVNAPDRRTILFSVWSPFKTDNPADVPEELKVKCIRAGRDAKVGEFGNEGSGGQVFYTFPWEAGKTYGFLTRIRPNGDKTTDYTAYFCDVEKQRWYLVAAFRRPKTDAWCSGAYSFVENFRPEFGHKVRTARYSNTWVWDNKGKYYNLDNLCVTTDDLGKKGGRIDYTASLTQDKKSVVLKMGGFFEGGFEGKQEFERVPAALKPPMINFSALQRLN